MRWSKLKQRVEEGLAKELRGRVQFWTTRYHDAPDRLGRSWITMDGKEVVNMSNSLACGGTVADYHPDRLAMNVFAGYDLALAMREFLTLNIDDAIASPNPLTRALAVCDARTGKRRLARFELDREAPLVATMLKLRDPSM